MREAVVLSSKIEFNAFKPLRKLKSQDWRLFASIVAHLCEANGIDLLTTLDSNPEYQRLQHIGARLVRDCGMSIPDIFIDSSIQQSEALQELDKLRGFEAASSSLVLLCWALQNEVDDPHLIEHLERIKERGMDEQAQDWMGS